MRLDFQQHHRYVTATLSPEQHDRLEHGKAVLARREVTFEMPPGYRLDSTHPDLLALAAYAIASPWVVGSMALRFPVSMEFAEATARFLKIETVNASTAVSPRKPSERSRPGLSFSAGVDSLAALAIMPEDTVPVFSHRAPAPTVSPSLYKDDAPLFAIEKMNEAGRETFKVTSDLEWLRKPVGFGVDPSPAVPLILMADHFDLDAIAFGTIAEAAYRTGTEHFIDYADRGIFTKWQGAFRAAGIDYYNCVAPISELCTTKITRESKFGHLAQSCVRGMPGEACMNCVKCFRKSLIEAAVGGDWPSASTVSRMMANRSIKGYLSDAPIRLEIVLMAALSGYKGDDPMLLELQDRVEATTVDTSFVHASYRSGIDRMVPEKYRAGTIEALAKYVPEMTEEQQAAFESFDIRPKVERAKEDGRVDRFLDALEQNSVSPVK